MISRIVRTITPVFAAVALSSLLVPAPLSAQVSTQLVVPSRLTQPIDDNARVALRGTLSPLANAANDRGAVSDSQPLDRIQIVLKRSDAQESALQQLIHDEHTPGTANYHKWLTPTQFGQQFGPSDQDISTLEAWLESKGFQVQKVNPGKQTLEVSGNVAQFRSAFNSQIRKYQVNGQIHYANATAPQIPAALAPVFGGFASLNNFPLKHYSRVLGKATYDTTTHKATPQWTYGTGNLVSFVLAPGDFAVQYDVPTSTLTGAGQTIAVINETNINVQSVNLFRTLFNLPANPPQVIIDGNDPGIDGINNPDGPNYASDEAYLDVEWAGAVAPQAQVDLVIAADTSLQSGLVLAAEDAVYSNLAPVISLSFGNCEANEGSINTFFSNLWEQAAAQGITVSVSSGDSGSAACDADSQYFAVNGLAVSGTTSTPYNVSVGGTDFYYTDYASGAASAANYWNTTATQSPAVSLKTPIPEQPWNDSQFGLNAVSYYNDIAGQQATTIAGGGGGASSAAVCAGNSYDPNSGLCTGAVSGYPKPAWQSGTGVPSDKVRDIPDVSLFAADGLNYSYYPICAADGDCQPVSGSNLVQFSGVGGTSASAPAFAGIMALVNQQYGRQGQADYVLYPLAAQFPAAFHDVSNGTNAVPCAFGTGSSNTPNCNSVSNPITVTDPNLGTATEGELSGYSASAGYDQATGLGTLDVNAMISDWGSVKFSSTTVNLGVSPTTFVHGTPVTLSGTVNGSGGSTPTGDISILTDSSEPFQGAQTFTTLNSSGAFSLSTTTLPGGTYDVWANYAGDAKNAAAQSQKAQITVSPEASGIYLVANDVLTGQAGLGAVVPPSGATFPYGTQLILSALVAPSSQLTALANCQTGASATCPTFSVPTGVVTFADNGATINTAVINLEGDAEFNAPWKIGAHSATASYAGDSSYNASTASPITFTIGQDTPNINVYPTATTQDSTLASNQTNALTIQVANSANFANTNHYGVPYGTPNIAPPTGTVTFSGFPSGTTVGPLTLTPSVDGATGAPSGIATVTIPATGTNSSYNVTISYSGDANYSSVPTFKTTIPNENIGGTKSTIAATLSGSISPATSVVLSGTVTGTGSTAPTGGVLISVSGYEVGEVSVTPGSTGDVSTFTAVLNSQTLLQGSNPITVQYLGDQTYAPSSTTLSPVLSNPLSDFSMVPEAVIVPVTVGTAGTDIINLSSMNGFAGAVTYTCTAASGLSCSLSPATNTFIGNDTSTTILSINASSTAANGSNNVLITGTGDGGLIVHTLSINADVSGSSSIPSVGFSLAVSPTSVTLVPGASTTAPGLSVMPSGGFTGPVALTATVSGPSGATSPPTVTISPSTLDVNGTSAISAGLSIATTSTTTEGAYTVNFTGTYSVGGVDIIETTPTPLTINVSKANFTITASPTSLTVAPGGTSGNTSTLTVIPTDGFTGAVSFACAVTTSPAGAMNAPTCSAPNATVTGTANATSTLTVNTTAPTVGAVNHPLDKFFAASGGMVVAVLFLFGIPARRRNLRRFLVLLVFAGIVGLGIGCGGGSGGGGGGGGGNPGTTAGAYVLTVTATGGTGGTITATTTVNLTVN